MTDEEISPADQLYYAIKGLPGWYQALSASEDRFEPAPFRRAVGALISSILLAVGDEAELIAAAGQLDDDTYSGQLVTVFPNFIVIVDATRLGENDGSHITRVWPLSSASDLALESGHSYYDGTDTHPRSRRFAFSFNIGGTTVRLAPATTYFNPPSQIRDAAIYSAYLAIRDQSA